MAVQHALEIRGNWMNQLVLLYQKMVFCSLGLCISSENLTFEVQLCSSVSALLHVYEISAIN